MKAKRFVWGAAVLVITALLLWRTAVTPGSIDDPAAYTCAVYSTPLSLLPPIIAILLALVTKEVYTSLLIGIAAGAVLYANGNLELALNTMFFHPEGGLVYQLSDPWNVGILVFLVMLGILVALMNKAGGSAAFGRWASSHIKTRAGAQLATILLGVLIFVDDYFNCLTVGSVMRPVTDRQRVSRAKLAYLIDSTAAPVCIIAPVSSWAAAVTSSVPEEMNINGFTMFLRTIPYNYYAILTLVMLVFLALTGTDYGPMALHERNAARKGDLYTTPDRPYGDDTDEEATGRGTVADLLAPVLVLIAACVVGMVYTGGFFSGVDFITAFAGCDASVGLVLGSSVALAFTFVFYLSRDILSFQDFTSCIPEGFKEMVAPILILSMAWTLSGVTGLLGAKYYVADLVQGSAGALQYLLPVLIFAVAIFLAFATGTSWGTFAILVPIVCNAFPSGEMLVVSIAACLSGAVCGDHCSPISDTTIMASAGAHSNHVNHVSTQLPYAMTVAGVSAACYALAGGVEAVLGGKGGVWASLLLLAAAVCIELAVLSVLRAKLASKEPVRL
ncbi:MAG: Na+/H+ antiporter NhaC family protein [Candidatus Faecalibacterium intestinavium]|uniref:Na+/H+ antiporter NhaC family protein n=1 Tax=Candidatus Faecalibacterium intestinavium TaxID=2838580 RepID=A0A9E2KMC7_9FIRM|nr:Na+/H+ antiporter NhaC family protein [Candidatus Faecalibacterium intestinavium]